MKDYVFQLTNELDGLAIIMMALIIYIGVCVIGFSSRYMKGDAKYRSFFIRLTLLIFSVMAMVCSDHLYWFLMSACFSNFLLVTLMVHKSKWKAAKASGILAAKNYLFSLSCMTLSFLLFYAATGTMRISAIVTQHDLSVLIQFALLLLLIAAMSQSAIWPFHKWLLSSLNSPTPISAVMHAGLINGGGVILVRFAPLYLQYEYIMTIIFLIGFASALIGNLWKLMQSDVKRMLACSTMGQMGFTFFQCGLGLFPLAVGHLFWHGMFKAYLFLGSGSAAQEKQLETFSKPNPIIFLWALFCGAFGSVLFAYASNQSWFSADSTLILMLMVLFSGTHLALSMLNEISLKRLSVTFFVTLIVAVLYGETAEFISFLLEPMGVMQPQSLNFFHIVAIAVLTVVWLSTIFMRGPLKNNNRCFSWFLKAYVANLNFSQPHQETVTAHRNHYKF